MKVQRNGFLNGETAKKVSVETAGGESGGNASEEEVFGISYMIP